MRRYQFFCIVAISVTLIAAAAVHAVADWFDVTVKILTRDPYSAAKLPPYYGYFSLVGSSVWLIAGTGTLTTAIIGRKVFGHRLSDSGPYRIVALGGVIGSVMALDDILLFHDAYADGLGIPEPLFHVAYAVSILSLIVYARRIFGLTPWLIFLCSLVCFGLSSVVDVLASRVGPFFESEDVFKLCGIVLWAFYFLRVSWDYIVTARPPSADGP